MVDATSRSDTRASAARGGRRSWLGTFVLLLLGALLGRFACTGESAPPAAAPSALEAAPRDAVRPEGVVWTCVMHPQIRLAGPGACPICAMDLVPVQTHDDDRGSRRLSLSAAAVALADIVTAPVQRRAVSHAVRMVGRVAYDETLVADITAWVPGRLDRLFVDYTGVSVRAGDHMVEIFSPQLISTQKELLQAIATSERLQDSPVTVVQDRTVASVESARERLRLWGLDQAQIDAIVERGAPLEHVTIHAPIGGVVVHKNAREGAYVETGTRIYTIADLSRVWVLLDAYESDLSWLHYGQDVTFRTEALPGEAFHGRIAFIDPVLDDETRTVKVRLNVDNADGRLKPDMFVRATVQAALTTVGKLVDPELADKWICPMHPEVLADGAEACPLCGMDLVPAQELGFVSAASAGEQLPLVVPASAPLVTGRRALVYVRLPDRATPTFEGREIVLGPRAGEWYVVAEGLVEGEQVVARGAFKLDSELQIQARPSMMSPAGSDEQREH